MNPKAQQRCYSQSIQPGTDVVDDDPPAFGEALEATDREGLGDIEEAEEDKRDEAVPPISGAEKERDPLTCDFINNDEAGVVAAALAGGDGGGGDAQGDGENDSGEKQE
jgi:hypothetical protein